MDKIVTNFYANQSVAQYERSHGPRLDFLVEDLGLANISNARIGDFGCGYGPIFRRLPKDKGNTFLGFDGSVADNTAHEVCRYYVTDLNKEFADEVLSKESGKQLDVALCFETMEHLTNPYNAFVEIKKLLKFGGLLFLSIPNERVTHNTIYPGLLYPVGNFKEFLGQMAFDIVDHRIHDKSFVQEVFTLRNQDWDASKLKFPKSEDKFRGITPEVAINL
jgi:2-polyprenyl-3-methyl-5-hydroxy-6-metoxy-1,4-benzoquinol methylase